MKAYVCPKYGSPSVLKLKEIEKPIPKDNELLVKIMSTTVNRTDCATLRGTPFLARLFTGLLKPKKQTLGTEFAGVVELKGKNVKSFDVGNRIFGFNDMGTRAHAEYLVIEEDKEVAIMPMSLDYGQAAASIEGAHYAINIINKVKIEKGTKVMVNGATGGIGSAALQLLKYYGAKVTATGNTGNLELLKTLGADKVIDYTLEDFTKDNEKYDYVFDTVGKSTFAKCKPLLKPSGSYISSELGPWSQNVFLALFTPLFGKKKVKFPYPKDIKGSIQLIKKLVEERKFKAVIDKVYPFEQIIEAFRYVETGQKTGNVVISIRDKK